MNVADVADLYDYNYWANARVLDAAARVDAARFVDPEAVTTRDLRGTLVHQLDVEWSWRLRWQGLAEADVLRDEAFPDVAALAARWRDDEREMRAYLAGLDDETLARPSRSARRTRSPSGSSCSTWSTTAPSSAATPRCC